MRRSLTALAAALTGLSLCLSPLPLMAQDPFPCTPRAKALGMLGERGQAQRARGLAGQAMMELFVNPETDDWSLIVTLPDGRTCVIANGIAFSAAEGFLPARGQAL